jgi:hypothetical protein
VLVGGLLAALLAALVVGGYLLARAKARDVEPGRADRMTDEVVAGLMAELRKWQAEAAHWKATAERLQREIDHRQ